LQLSEHFFRRKLSEVRDVMSRRGLDGLLLVNPLHTYYTTGFWHGVVGMERPVFCLIRAGEAPVLLVSKDLYGHREGKRLSPVVDEVLTYDEYPYAGPMTTMEWAARTVEDLGLLGKRLGMEDNFVPVNDGLCRPWYDEFSAYFRGTTKRAGDLVARLRMVKDDEEIALLGRACHYADLLTQTTSELIEPGAREEEVGAHARRRVEERMRQELDVLVPGMAVSGLVRGVPRGYADDDRADDERILAPGVPIIINCFAIVGGYNGESERCGLIGEPTPRQQELFELAMACQLAAKEAVRPGASCAQVDRVACAMVEEAGFDYLYGVGHGVGLLGHEPPWVRGNNPMVLVPGMCITVEPGLHVPGEGSFHCSETVLVTEDGCETLTPYDGIHRFDLP